MDGEGIQRNDSNGLVEIPPPFRGSCVILHFITMTLPSAKYWNVSANEELFKFIGLHQNLFRMLAICGFINTLFDRLMTICEDDLEDVARRKSASFWVNQIVAGYIAFKEFKNVYKSKKEKRVR